MRGRAIRSVLLQKMELLILFDAREGIEVAAVRIALEKGIDETRLIELERINQNMEDANIAGRIKEKF